MSDTREELLARVKAVLVAHDFNEALVRVFSPLLRDLAAFLSTPTPEEVRLEAEIARKDKALQEIAAQVIGDCPAALFDPEFPEGWAIRRFSELRAMASAALALTPEDTPAQGDGT